MNLSFQEKTYKAVKEIPEGKVLTYKQVAEKIKKPRAYRAVGNVLNKNKNPETPCHRVIRSDGYVGGYNKGYRQKRDLLKAENVVIRNRKVVR